MRRRLQVAVSLCLFSLAALGPSRAQTITSLSSAEVASPDRLSLFGTGFLNGAPTAKGSHLAVRLVAVEGGKAYKTKFDGADDSVIHVLVRKLPPGEYVVRVSRKGVPDFDAPHTITVRVPELLSVSNSLGFACGRASVNGRFLGELPGRVRVGGKLAKLLVWQPVFELDGEPATHAHQVTFVVPRGLGPGPHDVELTSFAGADTLESALAVEPTELPCRLAGGNPQLAATLDAVGLPKKLRSKPYLLVGWTPLSLDDEVSLATEAVPATPDDAAPFVLGDAQLAALMAQPLARVGADPETATTILGTARNGKAVRVIACALPGWEPEVGALLQGDDALAFDPVVVIFDFRIQGREVVAVAGWGGPASDVQLAVHTVPPDLLDGRLHVRFSADALELMEGEGAATIAVTEALILNAREVSL